MKVIIRIVVDGKRIFKHILVWLWNYGVAPLEPIRHINEDHTDDRLCNLTLGTLIITGTLTQERARELFDYDEDRVSHKKSKDNK